MTCALLPRSLCQDPIEKNFLKIIDFGLSCKFSPDQVTSASTRQSELVACCKVLVARLSQRKLGHLTTWRHRLETESGLSANELGMTSY